MANHPLVPLICQFTMSVLRLYVLRRQTREKCLLFGIFTLTIAAPVLKDLGITLSGKYFMKSYLSTYFTCLLKISKQIHIISGNTTENKKD
jgi:hypothetical protein